MTLEHKISIKATTDLVWAIITDFDNWPSWNPIVISANLAEGIPLGLGSVVQIKQPLQPISEWEITMFKDKKQFAWETQRPGLRMRAVHILEPQGCNTMSQLQLEVSGIISACLQPLLKPLLNWALIQENSGLKEYCEI